MMRRFLTAIALLNGFLAISPTVAQVGAPYIHDPSTLAECDGCWYAFGTGGGGIVTEDGWAWRDGAVRPGGGAAPDVLKIGDRYLCIYGATGGGLFGGHNGRILTMWNKTLDPNSPDFKWTTPIEVASSDGMEDCDAIDPCLLLDPTTGRLWATYGTYFGNIRLIELDPKTGERMPGNVEKDVAIDCEATSLMYRDGWYYLLGTHGTCCDGVNSTYNIVVGRSRSVEGPYVDNVGRDMMHGGGRMVIAATDRATGAGHFGNTIIDDGVEVMSFHWEADFNMGGRSVLSVRPLLWKNGWPCAGDRFRGGTFAIASERRGYSLEMAVDFVRMKQERQGWFDRKQLQSPAKPIANQTLEEVIDTWPAADTPVAVRCNDYMFRPHQLWTITPVPEAGGYLSAPYFKITIAGTDRALTATVDKELAVMAYRGGAEQLWRIEQLTDGTYRIMPKEIPGVQGLNTRYCLYSTADCTPTLAVYDFKSDNSKWNLKKEPYEVKPVAAGNPYCKVKAGMMQLSRGLKTEQNDEVGIHVTDIRDGDYALLPDVQFGSKMPRTFTASVASGQYGGQIEIRLDSIQGQLLGTLDVPAMECWEQWQTVTADLSPLDNYPSRLNTRDLYLVFKGRNGSHLFNFDWWEMRGLEQVNMPLFQTKYTADPSPLVVGDTLFLYTSHDASPEDIPDENEKSSAGFFMYDWLLWSTTDMVNWTEHGAVASLKDFSWRSRENGAWAIQTVERNGKYYLYAPLHGHGIGVLEADSPYGPFKDPLDKPLVWDKTNWYDIDPSVYTDDDGQAYMYWGNPHTFCTKLGNDMISLSDSITRLPHIPNYQEGPWFYKRNGHYYLGFASTCCPEALGYAMSDSPMGPWEWKGYIMRPTPRDRGNHPGICDFKGHSYVFGQNYDLMHLETYVHHERRSVSATEITYNADGTIREVPYWMDQQPMKQLQWLNPFQRVEAETMAWGYGLKSAKMGIANTGIVKEMPESTGKRNMYICDIDDGEYIRLRGVDFGSEGARQFRIAAAAQDAGCKVTLRVDSETGPAIGDVVIGSTGSVERYKIFTTTISSVAGVHDLYICFSQAHGDVRLDYWQFGK